MMSIPFVPSPLQVMGMQRPQGFPNNSEINRDPISQPVAGMTNHNQMHQNKMQQQNYFPGNMTNNSHQPVPPTQQMANQFGQMTITPSYPAKTLPFPGQNQMKFSTLTNGSNEPIMPGRERLCQPPIYQPTSNFTQMSQQSFVSQQQHYTSPVVQPTPVQPTGISDMKRFVHMPTIPLSTPDTVQPTSGLSTSTAIYSSSVPPSITPNQMQTTCATVPPSISSPVQTPVPGYHPPNQNQLSSPMKNFHPQIPCSSPSGFSSNIPGSFPSPTSLGSHPQSVMNSPAGTYVGSINRAPTPGSQFSNLAQSNFGQLPPFPQQLPSHDMSKPAYPGAFSPPVSQQPGPGIMQGQQYPPSMPPGNIQSPQRTVNADMMPSNIAVREDDQKFNAGLFHTNTRGQVPPFVTTDFTVQDEGNSSPRFLCSTIYSVPCQPDMLKQSYLPFAVIVNPFADIHSGEMLPPVSDLQGFGPTRCNRCKAYICPYMKFIEGGRTFQCAFCDGFTEVPQEYFAYLDNMGQRSDRFQRPELCLGSYEFIATKDYCKNGVFPNPAAFIFMIDVSYNSIKSGFVQLLCQNMKDILKELPREPDSDVSAVRVGFVTYSDTVHFYNIKGTLSQPQMLMVSDVNDMFVPLVDGFLVLPNEAEGVIESLMEQIPIMFSETNQTEVVLGPVIQAGVDALKAAESCGKIFIFHSTLPLAEAPGKLRNREDRALLGTEKEKMILSPQVPFYTTVGQDCVASGCSVDLFLFPNTYIDIATIGEVCRLTGGQIYKYPFFQAHIDGGRLLEDLKSDITQSTVFDAVMRVRTSTGIRATDFYGNYYMANTTDLELATMDNSKSITVEIKYDDKLPEGEGAFVQVATLYTSCSGQRRIRINNLSLNTCTRMPDLFLSCMFDAIVHFFAKRALKLILEQTPQQIKEGIISALSNILAVYKKTSGTPSSSSQLVLPENLKLLPLYVNSILKSDAIFGSDLPSDDRSFAVFTVNSMDIAGTVGYFYPRLISLHDIDTGSIGFPTLLRCSMTNIKDTGAYLLENGLYMFMWIGQTVASKWIQDVFGVPAIENIIGESTKLPEMTTLISKKIRSIIEDIRKERKRYLRLFIIKQGEKLDIVFRQFLVEDRGIRGSSSYVEFLCQIQQEICKLSN